MTQEFAGEANFQDNLGYLGKWVYSELRYRKEDSGLH